MGAAKQLYVKRSHFVTLDEAKENTQVHMKNGGSYTALKGELIATNLEGDQMVITQEQKDNYIPVPMTELSDYEAQMAKGYAEMAEINLEMVEAFHHAENEAETTTNSLVNGEYKEY
ncbi:MULTISPECIES: hypothetical protein [Bacillus]|uniref:hypothetical protein n=1 Tax=Bacillus TaxID=1386 RepID=UPI0006ADC00A|nr:MULTISPECIES: hypothetical protein [Bacillus]AWD87924.1 hypothetical protein BVQ_10830 [Bacillus velezensis]KAF6690778.1 hypothetical protein G9362_16790 [Bacillus sp. EKM601B]KOS49112.1 hypothetical protein AN272_20020 [Bacillus amyloliquefaciens]MBA9149719.1 hypothetical protein [Bacillus sp. EKM213B]MCW8785911.1 hypothetical protein [Bacillus velezensis]